MIQAASGKQGAIAQRARDEARAHGPDAFLHRDAPWEAAGNQTLQRLFASGKARASLKIGGADDPEEREADRTAAALMQGASACSCSPGAPPCPHCRASSGAKLRRKARRGGDAGGAEAGNLALAGGRPLAAADRHFFEPRLGADLGGVRLHTGSAAEGMTEQVGARAFALGDDIVFGRDELRPQTSAGRRLLAHELAHIADGHSGLRRDPNEPDMTPASAMCEPEAPGECSMLDPATVPHAADFDPCAVDVGNLTNYELLAEYRNALGVVNRGRGAAGYFEYRNLQRRLIAERDRRVEMGHAWLATMPEALPDPLYKIVERGGGLFDVVAVPGATVADAPENVASSPLMTQAQFDRFLETRSIERVDADTYLMRTRPAAAAEEGGAYPLGFGPYFPVSPSLWPGASPGLPAATPFTPIELPSLFSRPPGFERLPKSTRGELWSMPPAMDPERTRGMARALARYRATPGVPEHVDVEGRPRAGGTAAVAETDVPTLARRAFGGASAKALPPGMRGAPGTTGGSVLVPANPTAVAHGEHVALENLRRALVAAIENGEIRRSDLRGRTVFVLVEQEPCSSCVSGWREGRPGVLQQFSELFPELTVEVRDLRTMGSRIYRGGVPLTLETPLPPWPPPKPTTVFEPTPEFLRSRALGGGVSGALRAGGGAALRGGGLGGLVMVVTSAGVMAFDEAEHPNWESELALTGGLGTLASGTGVFAEHMLSTGGSRIMLSDVAATGTSRLTPGLVTGAGRFGGGAVGAMFVEGISMGLLEERDISALEATTRMGRSAALGGGSVWAGAAVGTAAGVWATAAIGTAAGGPVGFIVGLAVGGVLYYVGDKLVPGGREDWDAIEAGCRPLPSLTRLSGAGTSRPFSSPPFTCFDGDTLVLMGDGTRKAIADVAIGDRVLGYNEQEGIIEARAVTKVHRAAPAPLLRLRFENGIRLLVTASHKLSGPAGWRSAGDLRPGDSVWRAAAADGLEVVALSSVTTSPPRGPVYDLSIDTTHTYFAAGVLAHNKLP